MCVASDAPGRLSWLDLKRVPFQVSGSEGCTSEALGESRLARAVRWSPTHRAPAQALWLLHADPDIVRRLCLKCCLCPISPRRGASSGLAQSEVRSLQMGAGTWPLKGHRHGQGPLRLRLLSKMLGKVTDE